ncbi:hypothetical protein CspHIS471_0200490 [Cutaneotrichosporon sp. HIS471]|nr:hypothetical protein CspHIS471_0200490 [Cutaneotrichosporon sp. HIS471]
MYLPSWVASAIALVQTIPIGDSATSLSPSPAQPEAAVQRPSRPFSLTSLDLETAWGIGASKVEDGAILEMFDFWAKPDNIIYWNYKNYYGRIFYILQAKGTDLCLNATVKYDEDRDKSVDGPVYLKKCPTIPDEDDHIPFESMPYGLSWALDEEYPQYRTKVRTNSYGDLGLRYKEGEAWVKVQDEGEDGFAVRT